jgi:hypothetical protein
MQFQIQSKFRVVTYSLGVVLLLALQGLEVVRNM